MNYEIKLAKEYGFCWGVQKAVDKVKELLKKKKAAYCLGPLIHNPQINNLLVKRGLRIIKDLRKAKKGILVIPAHGLPETIIKKAKEKGLKLIDATCPFVQNLQQIVARLSRQNYQVVIIGERGHGEVQALISFADKAEVIEDISEIKDKKFLFEDPTTKIGIIVQTTQTEKRFVGIIKELLKKEFQEIRIFNTLCRVVQSRQKEAAKLAKRVELMLVIGGKESANTGRLAEICAGKKETYHIEGTDEIRREWLKKKKKIGIITGTSTPKFLVEEVIKRINETVI